MRKYLPFLIGAALLLVPLFRAPAAEPVTLYLFWGEGCPHCEAEKRALVGMTDDYPQLTVRQFEVYKSPANAKLLQNVAKELDVNVSGVPFTIIGDKTFAGFSDAATLPQFKARIDECLKGGCPDSVAAIVGTAGDAPSSAASSAPSSGSSSSACAQTGCSLPAAGDTQFTIPLLGTIDAMTFSLPLLAVVMGVLDGFNPCAMWTLVFLLSLLLGMANRVRMWTLGTAFIITSAFVYFLFMTAWLQLILFIGFIFLVRLAIAALAIGGGSYSVYQGWKHGNVCLVEKSDKRKRVFQRLKEAVGHKSLILALLGIVALAFAVNLVELVCSAGLPAVFTQVLALNSLPTWQYYALILLYIFFFMIDDLFVFFITMATLEIAGITSKYTRISHYVGGTIMVIIGILLLWKPELLMFG